jgi:AcrR family transcriptional regulator
MLYRERVLDAAEREFARVGYADTRMPDVARLAGLSLATVYKTVVGKAELWDELQGDRMAGLLEAAAAAMVGQHGLDRLLAGVGATATYLAERPDYLAMSLSVGTAWATADGTGVQRTVWSDGLRTIEDGFASAQRTGETADLRPGVAAGLVVSALQVWLSDWLRSGRDRPTSVVAAEIVAYLRRLLAR